jgi:hypothetical protein
MAFGKPGPTELAKKKELDRDPAVSGEAWSIESGSKKSPPKASAGSQASQDIFVKDSKFVLFTKQSF